jgi:hypothetical protein
MERRTFIQGATTAALTVVGLPGTVLASGTYARHVSVEEILARVRERLTDRFFVMFDSHELNVHLDCAVDWVNAHDIEPVTLKEVCALGDPLADAVAWTMTASAAFVLDIAASFVLATHDSLRLSAGELEFLNALQDRAREAFSDCLDDLGVE